MLYGGGPWVQECLQDFGPLTKRYLGLDLASTAKFTVAFIISYQGVGSARHAYWDVTAKGFTNQQMLHSSYAIFGARPATNLHNLWMQPNAPSSARI